MLVGIEHESHTALCHVLLHCRQVVCFTSIWQVN